MEPITKLITKVLVTKVSLFTLMFSENSHRSLLLSVFSVLVCEDLFISFLSSMPHLFTLRNLNESVSFCCIRVINGTIIFISYFIFFFFKDTLCNLVYLENMV